MTVTYGRSDRVAPKGYKTITGLVGDASDFDGMSIEDAISVFKLAGKYAKDPIVEVETDWDGPDKLYVSYFREMTEAELAAAEAKRLKARESRERTRARKEAKEKAELAKLLQKYGDPDA